MKRLLYLSVITVSAMLLFSACSLQETAKDTSDAIKDTADGAANAVGDVTEGAKDAVDNMTGNNDGNKGSISEDEAKNKVFDHAKADKNKTEVKKIDHDTSDGKDIYRIEFSYDGVDYKYEVDAKTGEVKKM